MTKTVLLVEDDARIASFLKRGLEAEGFAVQQVGDGPPAIAAARQSVFSFIILDRMLPSMDGLEVCRRIRQEDRRSLILMLTARDQLQDKIDGLKGGADDYLTKPFAFDELLARMETLERRANGSDRPPPMQVADLRLDPATRTARRGQREIQLTAKEWALLAYLIAHAGQVVSRTRILSDVWGLNFDPGTKIVDVYIRYLRRKVDEDSEVSLIKTSRGFGYMIGEAEPDVANEGPAV
ncbi:DNA-binding response regulator, OmpR family, contains REC and winged-helix (wHTH) domain [Arboricoccus pini]|uniref:DNA-binding response regulator, OmpR family, contains REC and winged-helix (WHTH) domain n=1 Tax=Arboricoccus pini TaxID=1963835 RepID=A0A212QWG9_9PROT|nr:response regulator transcription factor [Arboricoccus pini]SNB64069.1 DNA-binding response regulator, OmpR family, contains REC and winged-helix (wHTH) domain [Arboricoccus pini]